MLIPLAIGTRYCQAGKLAAVTPTAAQTNKYYLIVTASADCHVLAKKLTQRQTSVGNDALCAVEILGGGD